VTGSTSTSSSCPAESCVVDVEGRPLVLFETEYLLRRTEEKYKSVIFISAVQPGRSHRAAA